MAAGALAQPGESWAEDAKFELVRVRTQPAFQLFVVASKCARQRPDMGRSGLVNEPRTRLDAGEHNWNCNWTHHH